jgi:hypothetical protein
MAPRSRLEGIDPPTTSIVRIEMIWAPSRVPAVLRRLRSVSERIIPGMQAVVYERRHTAW